MEQLQGEEYFRAIADEAPQLTWLADRDGYIYWYNKCWYSYTGTTAVEMAGWGWQSVHDPKVLEEVLDRWKSCLATGDPFEMIFPLKSAQGEFRNFLTRVNPLRDGNGEIVRWLGTNTDIEAQSQAERQLQLVIFELNHRVKNLLSMVHSIARQTLRSSSAAELDTFTKRLSALAGAHDVLARQEWKPTSLRNIVEESLRAFEAHHHAVIVDGPEVLISSDRAAAWGMAIHELGTNAVKYGAWSTSAGRVGISWKVDSQYLTVTWRESGGPGVVVPQKTGFGSRLIKALGGDLGGGAKVSYEPTGVVCEVKSPLSSIAVPTPAASP